MINKHLKWKPIAIALTATILSFAIIAFSPTSALAKGGSSAPEPYKSSNDGVTCEAHDSSLISCSTESGWNAANHNTSFFYYDPSLSTGDWDIWPSGKLPNPGDAPASSTAQLACRRDGGYTAESCFLINPGGNPMGGTPIIDLDSGALSKTANPPDICSIKMFGGSNPSHPTSCKWGGDGGSVRKVPDGFVSGYDTFKGKEDAKHNCENAIGMLSFILCPFMGLANNAIMAMIGTSNMPTGTSYNSSFPTEGSRPQEPKGILISMLEMRPLLEKSDDSSAPALTAANEFCQPGDSGYACGIRTVWSNLKNITLGLYVVIFLVIIFANTASLGIDNYTIKKMLPRLIASAVLIQFSLLIVSLAVDVFNIVGSTIPQLILGLASSNTNNFCGVTSQNPKAGAMGPALGMAIAVLVQPGVGQVIAGIGGLILLVLIVMVAIAVITAFFALIVRKLILFGLVIAAPLAFAAYILPGTEKYFKLWRDNLLKSLAMYPIATGLLAGSLLFSSLIIGLKACHDTAASGMNIDLLIAILAPMMALLMLPKTFKWGGHLTSAIAGGIMGAGMRANKRAVNAGKNATKRGASAAKNAGQDRLAQSNFGKNSRIGRFMAGGGITSFARKNSKLGQGAIDRVEQRANAARQAEVQRAGSMLNRAADLEAQAATLPAGSSKAAKLTAEAKAIRDKLYGTGSTAASRAAAATASLNTGDQATHAAVTGKMDPTSRAAWERTLDSGQLDRSAAMLHAYGQTLAPGSNARADIYNRLVGSDATPRMQAAGLKAIAAAGDGAGVDYAINAMSHAQFVEAVSANPGTAKAAGVALANHYNSMPGSIDDVNAHDYNAAKADLHARITGFDPRTNTVIANQPTDDFKAGVLSVAGKNTAVAAGVRDSSSEATWKRLNAENPTALDAQKFQGEYHPLERVKKIASASGDDIFSTNKDDQQVILSPENLGGVSADPNHGGGVITGDQVYNTSQDVLAKTDREKVRAPLASWAYGTDASDSSTAAYALGAHYAALESARASGNTARAAHHESEIARIQGLQTSVQTRLSENGDLKAFDPTAPRPVPKAPISPIDMDDNPLAPPSIATSTTPAATAPTTTSSTTPAATAPPPNVGTPYVNPAKPSATPAAPPNDDDDDGGGGAPPPPSPPPGGGAPPIPEDETSDWNQFEELKENLVNEVVSPAPVENTTATISAATTTAAGPTSSSNNSSQIPGQGALFDSTKYTAPETKKDLVDNVSDWLKFEKMKEEQTKMNKKLLNKIEDDNTRNNEINRRSDSSAPDPETPNE